ARAGRSPASRQGHGPRPRARGRARSSARRRRARGRESLRGRSVHRRVAGGPTMTASRARLAGLLVPCVAVLVSCGVPTESATNPIRDQDVPYELLEPAATTSTPRAEGTTTTARVSETIPL